MKVAGMKDCVELYAQERGISKAQAETEFKTAVKVIADMCIEGGVSIKGVFTIKQKVQKGRSGNMNGKEWTTEDKTLLKITTGSNIEKALNS